ncbi:MAG TPA: hypothetical protein VG916_03890 [Gemmatimonadaceae bacterium]|nr:hypothetical protein [Gemmatimonadaceae bacterium]
MRRSLSPSFALAAAFAAALAGFGLARPLAAQSPFDGLQFRSIGPAVMGGRIQDVEVDPRDNATIYVAAATGGIWKTTNHGTTWTPIFEGQPDNAFGDLAIFAGDPRIIWAGAGEQNNRQSSSWGNGVYRSTDAGATWTFVGLRNSAAIGRIVLHPTDPNIAYVAAQGNLWKPTTERGLYKTTDGGKTWSRILYVDSLTGATEVVMDPRDPSVLYAATYQRLRGPFTFNGGGPGSALWKSTDAGATWQKLAGGLPSGDMGRTGLAIARSNPNILVATIEHATAGGTYRTEDAGATWRRMSGNNPRPMYFSAPYIDPTNDQRVWELQVQPQRSEDGGATFFTMPNSPTYDLGLKDDHHVLWTDPRDNRHLLLGGDGGLHESWDMGITYNRLNNFAVGQFYRVAVDDRDPYWIYGGMQDAHSWAGPSATNHWLGILNADWMQIGFSDGTGQAVDKKGPRYVYSTSSGGNIHRVDMVTGDLYDIQPVAPPGESYRYDWTAPVLASQHAAGKVFLGANKLLISRDFGSTWTATKDLTRQVNRDTIRMGDGVLNSAITLSRNDGDTPSEITAVAESPLDSAVLWVGTDDGNVQLSRDGGKTWTELSHNITGVANGTFVDRIVASGAGRGTAVVTFDGHRSGDFAPHIFRTTDFGRTWASIANGFAPDAPLRSIAEYPGKANVLFAGTERHFYYSVDSGASWTQLHDNLPTTRYDDIVVHPRTKDIVIATHGRSIWVLDDASPFAEWSPKVAAERAHLFTPRTATLVLYRADVSTAAHNFYAAPNPEEGAVFTYHLASAAQRVTFTVKNAAGKVIRELAGPTTAGVLHRVNWDLRYPPAAGGFGGFGGGEEAGGAPEAGGGRGGRGGRGGAAGGRGGIDLPAPLPVPAHVIGARGMYVAPGTFTVTMEVDGTSQSRTFAVRADPNAPMSVADQKAREAFLLEAQDVQAKLTAAVAEFNTRRGAASGAEATRLNALAEKLGIPAGGGGGGRGRGGRGGRGGGGPGAALGGLQGAFNGSGERQGSLMPPTGTQRAQLAAAKSALAEINAALGKKP